MEEKKEENNRAGKRWFGRGIYGSKDVPVRILDGLIIGALAAVIILTVIFTINGGFYVAFDTDGGSQVEEQKRRYGEKVSEPEVPFKAGYDFRGWVTSKDVSLAEEWNFVEDEVAGDTTLYALWEPARIRVKLDLNGGTLRGGEGAEEVYVTFGEAYGSQLPVPEKEGAVFAGWEYGGILVDENTVVTTSGEHVLTARWDA